MSPIYVCAEAYPAKGEMSLVPSRPRGAIIWIFFALSLADVHQLIIVCRLNLCVALLCLAGSYRQSEEAELLMRVRRWRSGLWFPGLELRVFLAPFFVAFLWQVFTQIHLKCLELQAAISIHGTRYANMHITAHTWRTFSSSCWRCTFRKSLAMKPLLHCSNEKFL